MQFNITLNRLQYTVNVTFICTGKPRNSRDSHYCDIHFIVMVWSQTCNISEVHLNFKTRKLYWIVMWRGVDFQVSLYVKPVSYP